MKSTMKSKWDGHAFGLYRAWVRIIQSELTISGFGERQERLEQQDDRDDLAETPSIHFGRVTTQQRLSVERVN